MPIFVRYPTISLQFITTKDETQLSSNTFSLICLLACANVCKFSWLVRTTHMNCFFFLFGTLTFCLCSVDHAFSLCFTVIFEQTAVYPLFLIFLIGYRCAGNTNVNFTNVRFTSSEFRNEIDILPMLTKYSQQCRRINEIENLIKIR